MPFYMDENQVKALLEGAFWHYDVRERKRVQGEGRSFAHYTTTDAALSIINNREIWLRNSGVMNDYSEVAHGEACLRFCLFENAEVVARSKRILDSVQNGLHDRAAQYFVESAPMRRTFSYLLSISEHGPITIAPGVVNEEEQLGRLSMWRAYGAKGGIALIFRQDTLMDPTDVLDVYSSPVFYGNPDAFAVEWNRMLTFIDTHLNEMKQIDPELIWQNVQRLIHFGSLTCKHPGFREEREWRITYSADPGNEHINDANFNAASKIKREFRSVNGVPQRLYKIPFVDHPDEGLVGITLPAILDRVVIGPTQFPMIVLDALYIALRQAGLKSHQVRIAASEIPLRT